MGKVIKKRRLLDAPPRPSKIIVAPETAALLKRIAHETARPPDEVLHFALRFFAATACPDPPTYTPKSSPRTREPVSVGKTKVMRALRRAQKRRPKR